MAGMLVVRSTIYQAHPLTWPRSTISVTPGAFLSRLKPRCIDRIQACTRAIRRFEPGIKRGESYKVGRNCVSRQFDVLRWVETYLNEQAMPRNTYILSSRGYFKRASKKPRNTVSRHLKTLSAALKHKIALKCSFNPLRMILPLIPGSNCSSVCRLLDVLGSDVPETRRVCEEELGVTVIQ